MFFPSLDADAGVRHALSVEPVKGALLSAYHQELLRGPSPISVADRELIAAYVSGLNACRYCHETHKVTAEVLGADTASIADLVADPDVRAAPAALRPLLLFARKLTLAHGDMTPEDAEAVYHAGWDEKALHDLILVTAMFNFMNRFVHGHGIAGNPAIWGMSGHYLAANGYAGIVEAALADRPAG